MFNYSFALIFDMVVSKDIFNYSKELNSNLDCRFLLTPSDIPHITVVKFELPSLLDSDTRGKFNDLESKKITINFSGINLLPSKDGGIWVELSVIKNNEMLDIQRDALQLIPTATIKNKVLNNYRPHVTLSKINKSNILNLHNINQEIVRKKDIISSPKLGWSGTEYEFQNIQS